jgi:hypothetical protein
MIMVPAGGQILVFRESHPLLVLYDGSMGSAVDPKVSPDGSHVAFIIERDLFVVETSGKYSTNPHNHLIIIS